MTRPKIAIGVPVYNGALYLRQALEALQRQSYRNFVVHILDNCSTDDTSEIARQFVATDPRFHYTRHDRNVGGVENFHRAFAAGRLTGAPLFKWAAHDDIPRRDYLAEVIAELDAHPEAVLCHSRPVLIDGAGAPLPYDTKRSAFISEEGDTWRWDRHLVRRLQVRDPARRFGALLHSKAGEWMCYGVFRSAVLAETQLFEAPAFEDGLCAEIVLRGPIALVDLPLFEQRLHAKSTRYKSRREYLKYETGSEPERSPLPSYKRAAQFVRAVRQSPLGAVDQMKCLSELARFAVQPKQIANAILPGPNNYWGIDFSPNRDRHPTPRVSAEPPRSSSSIGEGSRNVHQRAA